MYNTSTFAFIAYRTNSTHSYHFVYPLSCQSVNGVSHLSWQYSGHITAVSLDVGSTGEPKGIQVVDVPDCGETLK